jgi:hypothetical protein
MVTALGYLADAWILGTYLVLARTGRARPFHAANALGCLPILAGEIATGAFVPMVLTVVFGVVGWLGVLKRRSA